MKVIFLASLNLLVIFMVYSEAKNETIVELPHKNSQSKWIWSWTNQWTKKDFDNKVFYQVCESSDSNTNKWIRSNVFMVGDATRIDVTVEYAVSKCSSVPSLKNCKETLKLYVYSTSIQHITSSSMNLIPEPWNKPEVYRVFGITSSTNLSTGVPSRSLANTETYSFLTDKRTPYYYFAVKYQGGCFELYGVTISYPVCPSQALPIGLIQMPRTIAPNGTIQVHGSCTENALPLTKNIPLYGHCQANGEWKRGAASGVCLCKAGYGKYLNGSGALCKGCPLGSYQDVPSSSACKPCPLNSVQDVDRKKCICAPSFYKTNDETIFDNCTDPGTNSETVQNKENLGKYSSSIRIFKVYGNISDRILRYMRCQGISDTVYLCT